MALRELIARIAGGWPTYHQKARVDSQDSIHEMVTVEFPTILRLYTSPFETIIPEGSTGAGNITAAPWIALFDRRITTSATTGYYVVYLFSTDMSAVTLCLAFGATQFEKQFGGPAKSFPRMQAAANRFREMFNDLIPKNLIKGPIDLAAVASQKLHFAYQHSTILSYPPYFINALPEEKKLVADLEALVKLYTEIVSDPLEVTIERLVEAVVQPAADIETISVSDFEPRSPRKIHQSSGVSNKKSRHRYSPESRKIGDAGERVVLRHEQKRLADCGRKDLADRVRWHAQEREFLGWDITSFDESGKEVFIEVKSSAGKTVSSVFLTANEWEAACHAEKRDRYYIYIVTNALSAQPHIERLSNPSAYTDNGSLSCDPIVFELQLNQP